MAGTLIYFENAAGETFTIRPAQPSAGDAVVCSGYDLGAPDAKESIEERVGRNGVNDNTTLHGASVAKFDLKIFDGLSISRWAWYELLKQFLDPTKRYFLCYQRYGESEIWKAIYRADSWSHFVDPGSAQTLKISVQVKLPDGCYESPITEYTLRPQGLAVGFSAPFSAPFSLTPSSGTGAVAIPVAGTRPVPFRVIMYGAQTGPVIMDTDTGRKLSFTASGGLDIPSGSYVEVDTDKGTALMNGDPNNSVYQYIDFSISQWWALRGGETNRLTVSATTSDGSAQSLLYVASRRL